MAVRIALLVAAALLAAISAFGFLNAFVLKIHGPGTDLGILAGLLAAAAAWAARIERREDEAEREPHA